MRQPIKVMCVLAFAACAADGVKADDVPKHDHGQHREDIHRGWCQTDDIVDALGTALAVSRKYQDIAVAEAEGYAPVSKCETSDDGTMGIHYAHPDKLAAAPNPADPPILVYLPTTNGLRLVALEYFQPILQDGEPYMGTTTEPPRED